MRENRHDQIVHPQKGRDARAQMRWVRAALLMLFGFFLVMGSGTSSVKAAVEIEPDAPVLPAVVPIDDSEMPFKVWLPAVSANVGASPVYIGPTDEDPTRRAATVELCLSSVERGQNIRGNWPGATNQQVWAGVLRVKIAGVDQLGFCTDINNPISPGKCYANSTLGVTNAMVACALTFYPPEVGLPKDEASARQATVWHFADEFDPVSPAAVKSRTEQIVADLLARQAQGQCPDVLVPALTLSPPSAVNFLVPQDSGYSPSTHVMTATLTVGPWPVVGQLLQVETSFGTLAGGGAQTTVTTDVAGRAMIAVTSSAPGRAVITATTTVTLPVGIRVDPGPTVQKIVANGNAPHQLRAAAQKEWVGGGSIVVRKFHDYNQNGVQDPGEPLINWNIKYRTEPDGTFSEVSLGTGGSRTLAVALDKTYEICEIERSGWQRTTPATCVTGAVAGDTVDFGNVQLAALLIEKYEDLDGDGTRGVDDPPLNDWGYILFQYKGGTWSNIGSGYTENGGRLGFANLPIGTYRIDEVMQRGWYSATATSQLITLTQTVQQGNLLFGNVRPGRLHLQKRWIDAGVPVPAPAPITVCLERIGPGAPAQIVAPVVGEVPLARVGERWCWDQLLDEVTIDQLWPGEYRIWEVVPPGWFGADEPPVFRLVSGGEASVTLENVRQRPSLAAAKSCAADVLQGNRVEYTLAVTNTGNVVLSDVAVIDAMAGLSTTIPLLKLGESQSFTATVIADAPGELSNRVDVMATHLGQPVTAGATCTSTVWRLAVSASVVPTYTQPYTWTIVKSASPITVELAPPASAAITYSIGLTRAPLAPIDIAVSGTVTVANPSPLAARLAGVDVIVDGIPATVTCPGDTVPPSATLDCHYGTVLPRRVDGSVAVTASMVTDAGPLLPLTTTAPVDFSGTLPAEIDATVTVRDDQQPGVTWPFTGTGSVSYTTTTSCRDVSYENLVSTGRITNTATIQETGQSATEFVTRICRTSRIEVTKLVDWDTGTPNPAKRFTICLRGPSYPTGTEAGACQETGYQGGVLAWEPVDPGLYTVSEINPGDDWDSPLPADVEALPGETVGVNLFNRYIDQGGQGGTGGTLLVRKIVDWGKAPPDLGISFTICITGGGFTVDSLGACQEVGAEGGEAVWLNLDPGQYTIVEPDIDPAVWDISGAGQVVTIVKDEETMAEVRNTNKNVPTALPPSDEPAGHGEWIFLPVMRR
ncbi:MAG: hypothetical protein KDE45_10160 [Caldilineaceae bacterium]|nr:hypothetical protein [Caldilineaceae bacterium]